MKQIILIILAYILNDTKPLKESLLEKILNKGL